MTVGMPSRVAAENEGLVDTVGNMTDATDETLGSHETR